jgi:hypothetical protein
VQSGDVGARGHAIQGRSVCRCRGRTFGKQWRRRSHVFGAVPRERIRRIIGREESIRRTYVRGLSKEDFCHGVDEDAIPSPGGHAGDFRVGAGTQEGLANGVSMPWAPRVSARSLWTRTGRRRSPRYRRNVPDIRLESLRERTFVVGCEDRTDPWRADPTLNERNAIPIE